MKKTFLLLLLMGLSCGLYADPVSPEKALAIANKVFAADPATKAVRGEPKIIWDGEFEPTKAGKDPAFYVVARDGGGFVMVAGDDAVPPVLALSFESPFKVEGMPDHLRYWMNSIKRYVRLRSVAEPGSLAEWQEYAIIQGGGLTDEYTGSRTLPWGQQEPANTYCPTIPGESRQSPCGCVPLTMAEVMAWFKYPQQGTGTVPGYTNKTGSHPIPEHTLGTVYDWDAYAALNTPQDFYYSMGSEVGNNVGQLLYDLGTLLQVDYSEDGTTGNLNLLASRLAPAMGYSKSAMVKVYGDGYPLWQWDQMLLEEVARHPTYYRGTDVETGGGHAWVLDGSATYNGKPVFHFNFGWYGYCNGYYYSNYLFTEYPSVEAVGTANYDPDYYSSVAALFGFEPDPSHTSDFAYALQYLDIYGERKLEYDQRGLHYTRDGAHIAATTYMFLNVGNADFSGTLEYRRVNKNGERDTEPVSSVHHFELATNYYMHWITMHFNVDGAVLGDRYVPYYHAYEGAPYEPIFSPDPSAILTEIPAFPAAFIRTESSYSRGDYFYFRLMNQDYPYPDAEWTITLPSGLVKQIGQVEDRFRLSSSGTYKIKVETAQETIVTTITVN